MLDVNQPLMTDSAADREDIKLDLAAMKFLQHRLSLTDMGHISVQIARAAAAKRPSQLQRLLLAIVRHQEADDE